MTELRNLTPFSATCLPSMSRDDQLLSLVVVAARFDLPCAGRAGALATLADEQRPVPLEDTYVADPTTSSLRHEGQSTYVRPGTDVYLTGDAWTPRGEPAERSMVRVRVGPCDKTTMVFGDRVWTAGITGVKPSAPLQFTSLSLLYERCFGGLPDPASASHAEAVGRNPVGRGLYKNEHDALSRPLPNFEDPQALLSSPRDRPQPFGFGPVARHWLPRRAYAGTYDEAWAARRMPLWPKDLDERFFVAASPGLHAAKGLQGGEPVEIHGMSPDGTISFALPRMRLGARWEGPKAIQQTLQLDAVSLEPDAGSLTMMWRGSIVADPLTIGRVTVRSLSDWEGART